ncbi:4531_t:CDS:2, partial [Paraglomus occultum]
IRVSTGRIDGLAARQLGDCSIYPSSSRRSGSTRVGYGYTAPPAAPLTVSPTLANSATPSTFSPTTVNASRTVRPALMAFSTNPIKKFGDGARIKITYTSKTIVRPVMALAPLAPLDPKLAEIDTLYKFIRFQSFDGFFKPTADLSKFFSQGKDRNLFQNKNQDSVWSTCIAMAYLEIVMKNFKEEWELCYEKAQTALNELSGYDSGAIDKMIKKARKWVTERFAAPSISSHVILSSFSLIIILVFYLSLSFSSSTWVSAENIG